MDQLGQADKPQRKKPGPKPKQRPAADMTERDMEHAGLSLNPRETDAHEPQRPKRVTMQGAMKLSIPPGLIKEGYIPRWFKDKDSRVQQAQAAYWEHIKDEQGNNLMRPSGPYMLYAMQLESRYVEEDKALKRDKINARIRKEAALGQNEYSNHGGNSALKSTESGNPFS